MEEKEKERKKEEENAIFVQPIRSWQSFSHLRSFFCFFFLLSLFTSLLFLGI